MRIDWWTLALQTINVLVLIWILARFFFRPVADVVARRQQEANRLLGDASAARGEAAEVRAEAEKARAEIGAAQDRLIAEAQKAAQIEKANLLAQVSQEMAKLRSEAAAAVARDRAAADEAMLAHAGELAVEIARRLLARLPREIGLALFLDGLCREVRALSSEVREKLTSPAAPDDKIEVVTAAPLSDDETDQVRSALAVAFGARVVLGFRSDPALIAGIELYGRNTIMRNSWRADLDRIDEELSRDRHSRQA